MKTTSKWYRRVLFQTVVKEKCVAIACNKTRESAVAGIVHLIKIAGTNNFADLLTKALGG